MTCTCDACPDCADRELDELQSRWTAPNAMIRPSWDVFFLRLAHAYSQRATCPRKSVGCILVGADKMVLGAGYNGSVRGLPHCDDVGCDMVDGHCIRTLHAEINALINAARSGVSTLDAVAYTTCTPCWNCFKTLTNAGVTRFVWNEPYRPDDRVVKAAKELGIELNQKEIT